MISSLLTLLTKSLIQLSEVSMRLMPLLLSIGVILGFVVLLVLAWKVKP